MKASVSIITYNHEKYIAQAINSVLMQKTNFDFEIIIGEDDSEDNTRKIVKEYKKRYPDKIKLFLNERENVIYIDDRPTGRWNFINNLKHAEGEYVAILEGDDYWTDPKKLQKQVDFLDRHPECAICFHNVKVISENDSEKVGNFCSIDQRKFTTLEDLLISDFIPTCSTMFRKDLFKEFPDWYLKLKMGDWALHILNANHGLIGYISELMGVYRRHSGGVWTSLNNIAQLEANIDMSNYIEDYLGGKYRKLIRRNKERFYYHLIGHYELNDDIDKAKELALKCVVNYTFYRKGRYFLIILRLYYPLLFTSCKKFIKSIIQILLNTKSLVLGIFKF